jgi:hypothetical protein
MTTKDYTASFSVDESTTKTFAAAPRGHCYGKCAGAWAFTATIVCAA